jgi:hypothetical protein
VAFAETGRPLYFSILKSNPCQVMAENDGSWFQEDNSWRKTTTHGENNKCCWKEDKHRKIEDIR